MRDRLLLPSGPPFTVYETDKSDCEAESISMSSRQHTHMRQLGHVLKSGRNNRWLVLVVRYKLTPNVYFTISEQVVYGLVKKLSEQN